LIVSGDTIFDIYTTLVSISFVYLLRWR